MTALFVAASVVAQAVPGTSTTLRASPSALSTARMQALRNQLTSTPTSRPSRKLFLKMIVAANGD